MNTRSGRFLIISGLTAATILVVLWSLRFVGETGKPVEKLDPAGIGEVGKPVENPDPEGINEPRPISEQQADTLNCQSIVRVAIGKALSGSALQDHVSSQPEGSPDGAESGPIEFKDNAGEVVGEYTTWFSKVGEDDLVTVASAVPSFGTPRVIYSVKIRLEPRPGFTMATKPGAISIAGTLAAPSFPLMGSNSLLIDGGERPPVLLSSEVSRDKVFTELEELVHSQGGFTGLELKGPGESSSPVVCEEDPFITAEKMNEYRDALRKKIKALCENPEAVKVTGAVRGNRKWGGASENKLVVIDAEGIGADAVFPDEGQEITGCGVLVLRGALRPRANLNLRWNGDVFVLGENRLKSDLLYLHGSDIRIDGNLVLLSERGGAASLELRESSPATVSDHRSTKLVVTGGLLCLADAVAQEAELELEAGSMLKVDGILGLFGSRIEIEVGGEDSILDVRGSLAAGVPRILEEIGTGRSNFEFEMRGKVNINYVEASFEKALAGLVLLEDGLGIEDMRERNVHYRVDLWKSLEDFEPGGEALQKIRDSLLHPAPGEELGLKYKPSDN